MRKRICTFVLVLVMAFALCACNRQIINIQHSVQEGKQKLTSVENCHLVLQLTINPQLVLYLDEAGTVLKAEAGNKDGESLLAVLELTGLSYEDAVTAVLSTAAAQNFLPEGATVQIEVLASADGPLSSEQTQQLEKTVTDYNEELASLVDKNVVLSEDCGAYWVQLDNMNNGDLFYSFFSGSECIREICYGADGSYHEWIYKNKQTVSTITVNADGTRYEEHQSFEDGKMVYHSILTPSKLEETTYYSDGTLQSSKVTGVDGFVEEQLFYENGNRKEHKIVWSDGSFGESYFNESGIITYSYESNDNGSTEKYYYTNGNVKTSLEILADGTVREREYNQNGTMKYSRDTYPDGSVWEEIYDEAGNRIEE